MVRRYDTAVNDNLLPLALAASVLAGFVLFMSSWGHPAGSRARRIRRWVGLALVVAPLVVSVVALLVFARGMGELSHH